MILLQNDQGMSPIHQRPCDNPWFLDCTNDRIGLLSNESCLASGAVKEKKQFREEVLPTMLVRS